MESHDGLPTGVSRRNVTSSMRGMSPPAIEGRELASVGPPEAAERVARHLARAQATGPHRTLTQDVAFGVGQLVEIAIRALSPAVNDTLTALTCIDWLADCLCKIAPVWTPTRVHLDHNGYIRVITDQVSYTVWSSGPSRRCVKPRTGNASGADSPTRCADDDHGANDRSGTRSSPDVSSGHHPAGQCESVPEASDRGDVDQRYATFEAICSRLTK